MDARPMSLATSPTRPHLEYAVRLSESPYKRAFAALKPDDEVRVFGPIGDFVLHETRPAVLVAGGVGITPQRHGRIRGGQGVAHPDSARLQQPERGRDCVSTRTRGAGDPKPSLPDAQHPHAHDRPRLEGGDGTD